MSTAGQGDGGMNTAPTSIHDLLRNEQYFKDLLHVAMGGQAVQAVRQEGIMPLRDSGDVADQPQAQPDQ